MKKELGVRLGGTRLVLGLVLASAAIGCKGDPGTGGGVSGSVYAEASILEGATKTTLQVVLPDIAVSLRRVSDGTVTATVTTDSFGRYYFPHQDAGTYQLRWEAQLGWAAGAHPDTILVQSKPRAPVPARIVPEKRAGVAFGRVTFSDGSTPWSYDELFRLDSTATVTVLDSLRTKTLAEPIHANAMGFFAAAGLPSGEDVTLRIECEASSLTRLVAAAAVSFGSSTSLTELSLENARPEIIDLVPTVGSDVVQTAAPGATITVTALTRDTNGDPVTHTWEVPEGSGTLAASGDSAKWTLPNHEGTYSAYLQIADGRGGYAQKRIDFITGRTHVTFSGRAVDKSAGSPVAGASVAVNGDPATTDANGFFSVRTALAGRYVMNIEARGYALFSRVVDAALTGQTWRLVKTQSQQVDPTQPISITDTRPELDRQKMKGMKVRVPAGALVDASGKAPAGPLTAFLATLNIADGEAPGDWGGLIDGHETNLISFGAGFVEFVDSAGAEYNLKPGESAEVEFAAPASMLPGAPGSTPTWAYNPDNGYWEVNGSASLVAAAGSYVNKVEHFSTINTDLEKEDAACLGVLIYPPIPTGVRLRVVDPTGTVFTQPFEFVLDAGINAVYRLPANMDVGLELLQADGSPYGAAVLLEEVPGVPLAGNVVNTGPAIPAGESLWPPEPYVPPCKLVILREANEPTANAFFVFKGKGNEEDAQAYYDFVDPDDTRETLREWWETNGFAFADANGNGVVDDPDFLEPPTNAVRTSYLNDNDLGSGRDMYFLKRADGSVAAYVTNYGLFNQDHANADLAANRDMPGASVCMEWSAIEQQGTTRVVKFFVYNFGDFGPNAPRQTNANLDDFEPKYVPNLCNNCHGGSYNPVGATPTFAEVNMGASFRELDIATYKFPEFRLTANATEKAAFHQQNEIVRAANGDTISDQSIKDLIDGWYAGGTDDQDNDFTPPNFSSSPENALYLDVVRNSCRTCHVALGPDIDWTNYQQLVDRHVFLQNFVLCEGRIMPHAVTTYRNFWLSSSPHFPASLRDFQDGATWAELGPCE